MEEELKRRSKVLFSEETAYGNYQKPVTLENLIRIVEEENYHTDKYLSFILREGTKPDHPAPIDNIPFAWTGGDGCYFGFLTDFGKEPNLEEAPIIFVQPTDFSEKEPARGVKLFARNIKDFLRITIESWRETVRLKKYSWITKEDNIEREKISEGLIHSLQLKEIKNLEDYYKDFYADRESGFLIKTMDGIGISSNHEPKLSENVILKPVKIENLESRLNELSLDERKKFYRDFGFYLYPHYKEEFNEVLEIVGKYLDIDGFEREANIVNMNVKLYKDNKKFRSRLNKKSNER